MAEGMDAFLKGRNELGADLPMAVEAIITTEGVNASDDDVYAVQEGFSRDLEEGPCRWSPRVEVVGGNLQIRYPERGDRALLIMSDDNEPWIVEWWPYA